MGWKVIISPGAVNDQSAFSVDAKFKFDLQGRVHDNEFGKVEYIEYFIEVEGDVVAVNAATVGTNLLAIMDQLKSYQPRNVYLILDGVTKYTWTTAGCIGSPRVLAFRTVEEDGNASSHWRYGFTIYVKQGGNLGNNQSIFALETSLLVVSENGQVIKKVWKAYAKAASVAAAMAQVLMFKPADSTLHEEIERFFQENAVRASWTWELFKNFSIVEEPIQYTGNGKSYVWDYAVSDGANPPPAILHRAANEATKITIRGVVRGANPQILIAPPAHYSDNGKTLVRNESEEENTFPSVEDFVKGIWQRPYMEVWYWTGGGRPPAPNHSNHQKPTLIAPSNGPIGG